MNMKKLSILCVILLVFLPFLGCIENDEVNLKYQSNEQITKSVKQGTIQMNFTIRTNNTTELARLWTPYPVSNAYQEIKDYHINGNYDYSGVFRESKSGTMILYAKWENPETFPQLNLSFHIKRTERVRKKFSVTNNDLPVDVEPYLIPTSLGPIDGIVKEIADEIIEDNNTILTKAISIRFPGFRQPKGVTM